MKKNKKIKNKQNKGIERGKWAKFSRTETFTELYSQSVYVFVCFVCLDRCTDPSLGFCQWSKWVL